MLGNLPSILEYVAVTTLDPAFPRTSAIVTLEVPSLDPVRCCIGLGTASAAAETFEIFIHHPFHVGRMSS